MKSVLLSIRPVYVDAILNGQKHYEFRKTIFADKGVERVYIYSTSPVKKIIASFRVGETIKASPEELWERFGNVSGLSMDEFHSYYNGNLYGYAIKIEHLEKMDSPLDPYKIVPNFTPPQSYRYVSTIGEALQERLC